MGNKLLKSEVFNELVVVISSKIEEIINAISIILDYLENVFKGGWDGVWNELVAILVNSIVPTFSVVSENIVKIFDSLWAKMKNIINSILGGVEKLANGVVNAINTVIRALNGLSFDIPDWVPGNLGGKSFGFNIGEIPNVSIPKLANGAVIRGGNPFMAILGDQPAGHTNIEAPLATIEQGLENILDRRGGSGQGHISMNLTLNCNGEDFAHAFIPDILSELGRLGYSVEVLGTN